MGPSKQDKDPHQLSWLPTFLPTVERSPLQERKRPATKDEHKATTADNDNEDGGITIDADFVDFVPPTTTQLNSSPDLILANQMKVMSIGERERVYEDIHGVSASIDETPELINESLEQLQQCLDAILHKPAYDLALHTDPDFVRDRGFCLRFLRGGVFKPKDTAYRMVRHFETKLELWGADKIAKRITIDDFDDEMKAVFFDGGAIQLLPFRDTSGRAIVVSWERYQRQYFRTKNPCRFMNRLLWYYFMTFTEDEETQKNGIIFIGYGLDFVPSLDEDELHVWWGCCGVANVMPMRIVGFHYCYNNQKLRPLISLLSLGVVSSVRCRFRTHYGTHQECMYTLMTFGIPHDALPVNCDGDWRRTSYLKWARRQSNKEKDPDKYKDAVEIPSIHDVLLGRGKPSQVHPGNKRLHAIIAQHYKQYDVTGRREKTKIAQSIVDLIKASPGRFLKRDDNDIWAEVDDIAARQKVCHGFRRKREVDNAALKISVEQHVISQQHQFHGQHNASEANDFAAAKRIRIVSTGWNGGVQLGAAISNTTNHQCCNPFAQW